MPKHPVMTLLLAALATLIITSSLLGQSGNFGWSAAASGDDVFVGQPANFYGPGAVYLYRAGANGDWVEVDRMFAPDSVLGDNFGRTLAASGGHLLVGAPSKNNDTGAVYWMARSDAGAWALESSLPGPGGGNESFGAAVAMSEDVVFVGAPGGDGSGAVYQLNPSNGRLNVVAKLQPASLGEGARFGTSLSLLGDVLLAGAPGASSAIVYRRVASGEWIEDATLTGEGTTGGAGSALGSAVLLQDGIAFVGAPRANGIGAVAIFEAAADGWRSSHDLMPEDREARAAFGSALGMQNEELWVGAPSSGGGDGAVFRYGSRSGQWQRLGEILPDSANTAAWRFGFGASITTAGSMAVVGMPLRDFGEGRAAIVTHSATGGWLETAQVMGDIVTGTSGLVEPDDCTEGTIAGFECNNMELVSFMPVGDLGGARGVWVNDVWGWTDPETSRDYALVSRRDGAAFVDVTDPSQPQLVGSLLRTEGSRPSVWRDIKVYENHAFIVSDGAGAHGMQVFDLTRLRSASGTPVMFEADAHYDGIHSAHNVVANTETGFLYIVGASGGGETCGGGLHIIDARTPKAPVFAGCYTDATGARGYTHDAQCVVYRGPDERYTDREICIGSNEVEINIADVTDKSNPVPIGRAGYPNIGYAHQGWFDESQRYFFMGDEGDEVAGIVPGTRTLVWDLSELDDPILAKEYIGPVQATDHNLFVRGDRAYMANYGSGLRVLDISDPENPHEIAYFDSSPVGNNEAGMSATASGAWSNYPFFDSGLVVFTSVREGLFIVRVKPRTLIP